MDSGAFAFSYLNISLNYMSAKLFTQFFAFSLINGTQNKAVFTLFQYNNIPRSNSCFCESKNVQNKTPITSSKEQEKEDGEKNETPDLETGTYFAVADGLVQYNEAGVFNITFRIIAWEVTRRSTFYFIMVHK